MFRTPDRILNSLKPMHILFLKPQTHWLVPLEGINVNKKKKNATSLNFQMGVPKYEMIIKCIEAVYVIDFIDCYIMLSKR